MIAKYFYSLFVGCAGTVEKKEHVNEGSPDETSLIRNRPGVYISAVDNVYAMKAESNEGIMYPLLSAKIPTDWPIELMFFTAHHLFVFGARLCQHACLQTHQRRIIPQEREITRSSRYSKRCTHNFQLSRSSLQRPFSDGRRQHYRRWSCREFRPHALGTWIDSNEVSAELF